MTDTTRNTVHGRSSVSDGCVGFSNRGDNGGLAIHMSATYQRLTQEIRNRQYARLRHLGYSSKDAEAIAMDLGDFIASQWEP